MLYELFSWLHDDGLIPPVFLARIARSDLINKYQNALQERRKLIAEIRLEKLTQKGSKSSSESKSKLLEIHDKYIDFLQFIKEKMGVSEAINLYEIIFEYIASNPQENLSPKLSKKMAKFFQCFFYEDQERAMTFYDQTHYLSQNEEIVSILQIHKVESLSSKLDQAFEYQENPLGAPFLFREFVDDPEQTCAVILWLLRKNISVNKILHSNILQEFMSYHLSQLNALDSPVVNLYKLLGKFDLATPLVEAAGQISCPERGFDAYSLAGVLTNPALLSSIAITQRPIEFTATPKNFDHLFTLFGDVFLLAAFCWNESAKKVEWDEKLKQYFNHEIASQKLGKFINFSAQNGQKYVLYFSKILEEKTLDNLIKENEASFFHLLPFYPQLANKIDVPMVRKFLEKMDDSRTVECDVIYQLLALFTTFERQNSAIADTVYEKFLDKLLSAPQFLDDPTLIRKLKKYDGKRAIIAKKITVFDEKFKQCLESQVGDGPFTRENYCIIEDTWASMVQSLAYLEELSSHSAFCPPDKYALYGKIAQTIFKRQCHLNLASFLAALGIECALADADISTYERVLIELLTTIDDAGLRQEIGAELNQKYTSPKGWISMQYGEASIIERSARMGNVGLLVWLETKCKFHRATINIAISEAARNRQWKVVDYFCKKAGVKVPQNILDDILVFAAEEGELSTIQELCTLQKYKPRQHAINKAFLNAATKGHLNVVQFFCGMGANAPNLSLQVKAFNVAIKNNHLPLVAYLGLIEEKQMVSAIERGLIQAAIQKKPELVGCLCSIPTHKPSRTLIYKAIEAAIIADDIDLLNSLKALPHAAINQASVNSALIAATKSGHLRMVQYFHTFPTPPQSQALEDGLLEAVRLRRFDLVEQFFSVEDCKPRSKSIGKALCLAAEIGHLGMVRYFCELKENMPSNQYKNEALLQAASKGHSSIVNYFYKNPSIINQKVSDHALVLAAKSGSVLSVQCISERAPSIKAKSLAIKRASALGFDKIVSYLQRPKLSIIVEHGDEIAPLPNMKSVSGPISRYCFFRAVESPIKRAQSCTDLHSKSFI